MIEYDGVKFLQPQAQVPPIYFSLYR